MINGARYVPADYASWAHIKGCLWCGRAGGINTDGQSMHERAECLACGTPQCNSSPRCAACLIGWMPNWSRGLNNDRTCGYAKCEQPAVAEAPRVRRVCAEHLTRAKSSDGRTLAQYITDHVAVAVEHTGGYSLRWRWLTLRQPAGAEVSA